jgi:hypothetical protein
MMLSPMLLNLRTPRLFVKLLGSAEVLMGISVWLGFFLIWRLLE